MRIHFINVGYGEAILVERDGYTVLIDGGASREEEYDGPGSIRAAAYLKRLGIRRIDLIIITHIHDDHIGGIPDVIRSFPVSQVWINGKPAEPDMERVNRFESVAGGNLSSVLFRNALESYHQVLKECETREIPILQKGREDGVFSPAEDFTIEILTPGRQIQEELLASFDAMAASPDDGEAETIFREIDRKGNSSSIALRIQAGKAAALLSGDKVDGWETVWEEYGNRLECQILKLTHHGQRDGMPEAMVDLAQPEIFLICASADRRFGSAHPDVIARAHAFLAEKGKPGGVYVTGSLGENAAAEAAQEDGESGVSVQAGGEIGTAAQAGGTPGSCCAVWFDCDEKTGAIKTHYVAR